LLSYLAFLWLFLASSVHSAELGQIAKGLEHHLRRVSCRLLSPSAVFVHKEEHLSVMHAPEELRKQVFSGIACIIADLPTVRPHAMGEWFTGPPDVYSAHISPANRIIYFKAPDIFIIGIGDYHGEQGKIFRQRVASRLEHIQNLVKEKRFYTMEHNTKSIFIPWKQ
jgi:hypothetical protein